MVGVVGTTFMAYNLWLYVMVEKSFKNFATVSNFGAISLGILAGVLVLDEVVDDDDDFFDDDLFLLVEWVERSGLAVGADCCAAGGVAFFVLARMMGRDDRSDGEESDLFRGDGVVLG